MGSLYSSNSNVYKIGLIVEISSTIFVLPTEFMTSVSDLMVLIYAYFMVENYFESSNQRFPIRLQ